MITSAMELGASTDSTGQFTETHWTVVLAAGKPDHHGSASAMEMLCRAYWYPLYCYIRRRGYLPEDAQDLTQAFFARFVEKDYLKSVDRNKGKFRSFLLAALEHFLANEYRKAHTQKRGGNFRFQSLDDTTAEQHYLQLPDSTLSPERVFDQQWATTLLGQVLAILQQEFAQSGKAALFDALKIFLTSAKEETSYRVIAEKLGTTVTALTMTVSRMRRRYGELLRAEIAKTVSCPEHVDEELRALFSALS